MNAAALIAAAGCSTRMGTCKALLPFEGTTFLEHILGIFTSCKLSPIFVTYPETKDQEKIQTLSKKYRAHTLANQTPQHGLIGSIRSCLGLLPDHCESILITPVDCPFVSQELITTLIQSASRKPVSVPTVRNRWGHPILITKTLFSELSCEKTNHGLAHFLKHNIDLVNAIPWHDERILQNINTPAEYQHAISLG